MNNKDGGIGLEIGMLWIDALLMWFILLKLFENPTFRGFVDKFGLKHLQVEDHPGRHLHDLDVLQENDRVNALTQQGNLFGISLTCERISELSRK